MTTADRQKTTDQWMRDNREDTGFTKADVRAAINAIDDWVAANQTSYNNALPTAVKNGASQTQKTMLLCYVLMRQAGKLRVAGD